MAENIPFLELLHKAHQGSKEALGQLLENYRSYLLLIAREELDPLLSAKVGDSDLVQQTMLQAIQHFDHFNGLGTEDLRAWLRTILRNLLANTTRTYTGTQMRDASREQNLPIESYPCCAVMDPDPSANTVLQDKEEKEKITVAINLLPEHYREVILLHHQDGLSFEEIGIRIQRSTDAVRMMWTRAVYKLGQLCRTVE